MGLFFPNKYHYVLANSVAIKIRVISSNIPVSHSWCVETLVFFPAEDFHTEHSEEFSCVLSIPLQKSLGREEFSREEKRGDSTPRCIFSIVFYDIVVTKPLISFSVCQCLSHIAKWKCLSLSLFLSSDFKDLLGFTKLCLEFSQVPILLFKYR